MEKSYNWGSSGLDLGSTAFSYDLPVITASDSKVVLFADDTSIIITSPNQEGLKTTTNKTLYNFMV